ncbi:TSR3, pre-rRNA-processing protein TSR3 [Babesia microti strain RI]|uniref:18S rRNA aminocarboxypropyltransferase n=1 Tax=Babesia microti (strain RI) TaxID=1133968 RepID=I7I9W7_BABMR|nr:TSR3, pre-rRNA-processing protein TSR3 [Babesia microti strain RI]CCF75759.2 TSR3, pre-rRNA-processing protein TSR3 [Babesia microti strain RI]|eukprot:XP_021337198.1 TSR3, pre-rRNA-processing protein TSR3 [Babesia microti strain RI]
MFCYGFIVKINSIIIHGITYSSLIRSMKHYIEYQYQAIGYGLLIVTMSKPTIHDLYRSVIAKNVDHNNGNIKHMKSSEFTGDSDDYNAHQDTDNESPTTSVDKLQLNCIKLYLWDFKQCDSKKCTGRKLLRLGIVHPLKLNSTFHGIVLSPSAKTVIMPKDIQTASRGLAAIDCSWNQLDKVPFKKLKTKNFRLLPKLIASNPTHYGKPFELSCIEAYVAALVILGLNEQAKRLVSIYDWLPNFLQLNNEVLNVTFMHEG